MVTFLLRQLDASFHVQGRVEDEVTLAAKALRYPFPPSKTAITAVGAPTTWPAILAMLLWLVELLRYDAELRVRDADGSAGLSGDAAAAGSGDYFWWYLRQAYSLYLAGEDERVERLECDAVQAAFDAQCAALEAQVRAEEAALAALEAQLREAQGTQSVLPRLRADVADLGHDIAAASKTELEMAEFAAALAAKAAEVAAERAAAQAQLERARAEGERVAAVVAAQEVSQEDARRMAGTKAALRERRDALALARTESAGEADRQRLELRRRLDALQLRARDYHDAARQLQIIPLGAKWSGGQDWGLRLDERALAERVAANPAYGLADGDRRAAAGALLGAEDFKGGQKAWLRKLKAGLASNADKARASIRRELEAIADAGERRGEATRAAEEAEAAAAQLEAAARREAEAGELRAREQAAELARCEAARDERRAQLEAARAQARELGPAVLGELAAAVRHLAAHQEREREAVKDAASRAALRVVEHVQRVRALLEHASAAGITARNRQSVAEAERDARIRQVLAGSGGLGVGVGVGVGAGAGAGAGPLAWGEAAGFGAPPATPYGAGTPGAARGAVGGDVFGGARALPLPAAGGAGAGGLAAHFGALLGSAGASLPLPAMAAAAPPSAARAPAPPQTQPQPAFASPAANTRARAGAGGAPASAPRR